ncbi:group II intron reverse transcriptase/maturase [Enterococcus faecalis]|uniref:group II intron reverse transcriptase/maturase n=1 Tax=Enterococcus faecalis TaxID=1351 RepID=UPI0031F70028
MIDTVRDFILYLKLCNRTKIIISDDNILLAYRNIKRNSGSLTAGIDGKTIKDIEKLTTERYLDIVKKRFKFYKPRKVKRTEIPKPNGKTRPLGIPSIWDRVAQQCILQVLEPICEAKFNPHSHGFRPNRSAEHAIADCAKKMNIIKMGYCVDIDIQGFFDEVWHSKLMRQMWTMGIRDKELLTIIRKMLKAPVVLPNGTIQFPEKGTPQGGILSPLLANINLSEFDWWVSEQWETRHMSEIKTQYNANGTEHMGNHHRKMRSHTKLKEFYIVRYADDFKLFCHNRKTAELLYHASIQWLEQRLHLPVSIEKSKITNLRKESSEFLGFNLKLERKGKNRYIMHSHVSDKAINRMRIELKEQIKEIKKSPNSMNTIRAIGNYNSKVIGMHGYYRIATHVNKDFKKVHYSVLLTMRNRLSIDGLTKMGKYTGKDKGILNYVQSKNIRYLAGRPIIPVSFVQHRNPMYLKVKINKYTPEGRELIHRNQSAVSEIALRWIRSHPVVSDRATVEFNDNRISLFIAQLGKCSVTGEELNVLDMHCHHKIPYHLSKDDKYSNLIIVKPEVHILIHATKEDTIQRYMTLLNLNDEQVKRLNKLRLLVRNTSLHY